LFSSRETFAGVVLSSCAISAMVILRLIAIVGLGIYAIVYVNQI
jgi:hypothetical protein